MDTTSTTMSFRSYNSKEEEQDEQAFRRNTRKRLLIIAVSTLVLVAVCAGMTAGVLIPTLEKSKSNKDTSLISANSTLDAVCQVTLYPDSCNSSITSLNLQSDNNKNNNLDDPEVVFELSLQVSLNELAAVSSFVSSKLADHDVSSGESMTRNSLRDCKDLVDDAIDKVNKSRIAKLTESKIDDVRTWLSTAVTDHETCLEGVAEAGDESLVEEVRGRMRNSREYASNSLAIATNLLSILRRFQMSVHRKLLWSEGRDVRRVLEEGDKVRANVTVAKDGSGDYGTIMEAVEGAPEMEEGRYVIYVKEGVYVENVVVGMLKWNLMIYGDGMNKTIVSGSLNNADRTPTFSSGTLIAVGQGFIAKDMGFVNTAGPKKGQAVAVRSSSDMSIFYRCSFDAYQDTLYVHSNRQLFRGCLVTGTVDFIFGFATVVFQDSDLRPRQPLPSQFNAVTAHGKFDKNQNTGISIQRCRVAPNGVVTAPTFLGRPWKDYSTTVVMDSVIDGVVDPLGWSPWAPNQDPPSTIFYGEYRNGGAGSGLGGRVKWDGYRPNMTAQEAAGFSVDSFIQGDKWLPPGGSLFDGANV